MINIARLSWLYVMADTRSLYILLSGPSITVLGGHLRLEGAGRSAALREPYSKSLCSHLHRVQSKWNMYGEAINYYTNMTEIGLAIHHTGN